jgi:hypothetical protein
MNLIPETCHMAFKTQLFNLGLLKEEASGKSEGADPF